MDPSLSTRRRFLGVAASSALVGRAMITAAAAGDREESPSVRIGGPVFNAPGDPEQLALAHRKLGYRAAYCPAVRLDDREQVRALETAFAKHDVVIAEVGRWCNLLEADGEKRKANLRKVIDGLALADQIGARCCVNIAGSFNREIWYGPHPKNVSREFFDAVVENARAIIDAVNPKRAKFCYEMMGWALPDSADSYLELIRAVDRPAFAVHLDPCNLINSPRRFYDNAAVIEECFRKLGRWIASCHAKDIAWDVEMQVHFREVTLGTGSLDYRTYLQQLARLPHKPPLMIEHMANAEQYDKSRKYLFALCGKLGIAYQ